MAPDTDATKTEAFTVVVLAGGAGRRLGGDKANAPFLGGSLLDATLATVAGLGVRCLVVSKHASDHQKRLATGAPVESIEDATPQRHPLAGLAAGLRATATPWAMVVTCDAPLLSPALANALAGLAADGIEAVVAQWQGSLQPFPGLYRASGTVVAEAERLLAESGSMRALLARLRTAVLPEVDAQAADPEGLSFTDADTPAALADLERRAARGVPVGRG